ncbi:MAG TPA: MFS transporter [Dehalococcoidia bacterium]|nr:MFS transporter [Dehalococcoidia bacterium]
MTEAVRAERPPRRNRFLLDQWLDLLEDDSFRRYWLMRLTSHGATNALIYSILVFTVRQSESALATGALLLTMIVPSAMLGAIAGVAVDRLPRGLILFVASVLRGVLVIALISAKDGLPGIYAVSLGLGLVTQFAVPAEAAVVPHIVRNRSLVAANSFINLGTLFSQVLGMLILAPIFLKTGSEDVLLITLVILFAISAVLITVIPQFHFASTEDARGMSLRSVRREFSESWLHLSRDSTAFLALVLLVTTSITTLIIATMLPKFSLQVLHIEPENIVFVLAPVGIAIFLGLRSVEFLSDKFNKLVTISAAYGLMALSLIALGFVGSSADVLQSLDPLNAFSEGPLNEQAARIAMTVTYANIYGFGLTIVVTMGRVLINERVHLAMQGRIFAAQSILTNLVAIVPVVLAGFLADSIGVEPVLICAGIGAILAAAWSQARSSKVVVPAPGSGVRGAPPLR